MSKFTVIALGSALMLVSAAAAAETYRWVDAEGNVHYGDRPVRGSQEVDIRVAGETPAPKPTYAPAAEDDEAFTDEDERQGGQTPDEEQDAEEIRAKMCSQARERLERYEKAEGIYEEGSDGQRRELSLDERVETILRARQSVKEACEPPTTAAEAAP